jgi:hypothetical protein
MTPVQLAYLAGLLDGEGCITACKRGRTLKTGTPQYEVVVSIGMVDQTAILWALQTTGLGSIRSFDNGRYNKNWSVCHQWQVYSRDAAALLERVLPYLQIKRRQAELLIELTALKRRSTSRGQFEPERQAAIITSLRVANKRGTAA